MLIKLKYVFLKRNTNHIFVSKINDMLYKLLILHNQDSVV